MKYSKKTFISSSIAACLSAAVLGVPGIAFASDSNTSGEEDHVVIITATSTEHPVSDVPSAVSVVTKEVIEKQHYQTLGQALQNVPGLQFSGTTLSGANGGTNISIRGMEPNHTLVLLNGRRVTGSSIAQVSGTDLNYSLLGLNGVERIEVLRGGSGALYGSDAMGGVINIITKQSTEKFLRLNTELSLRRGNSDLQYNWNVSAGTGNMGKWNTVLSAGQRKTTPAADKLGGTVKYSGTIQPFHVGTVYQANENHSFSVDFDYAKEDLNWRSAVMRGSTISRSDYNRQGYTNGLNVQYDGKDTNSNYMVRFYWGHATEDFTSRSLLTGARDWDSVKHDNYIFETKNSTALNENHLLSYGFSYRTEQGEGTRIMQGSSIWTQTKYGKPHTAYKASVNSYAFYVQDEWSVNNRLLIVPAIRYDHFDSFDGHISPKLGMTYSFSPTLRLKFNIGGNFAAPGISELYENWPDAPGTYGLYGNPNLRPEVSTNFDLSLEKEYGKTTVSAGYFNNYVKNLIQAVPVDQSNRSAGYHFVNINRARLTGLELNATHQINTHWSVFGNYTLLNATDAETGERLGNRANHVLNGGARYNHGNWSGALWGSYYINYLDEGSGTSNERNYNIWNLAVNHKINDTVSVYVGIDNIFNQYSDIMGITGTVFRLGSNFTF